MSVYGNNSEDKYFENMLLNQLDDAGYNEVVKVEIDIIDKRYYFIDATVRLINSEIHEINIDRLVEVDEHDNEREINSASTKEYLINKYDKELLGAAIAQCE